jgi:hypothetical protein
MADERDEESPQQEEEPRPSGELPDQPERISGAAYFGGAAGLVVGVVLGMFLATTVWAWSQDRRTTEIFWGVVGPLLGFLGVVAGSVLFHRLFRGQFWLPAALFLSILAAGLYCAFVVFGFPWAS